MMGMMSGPGGGGMYGGGYGGYEGAESPPQYWQQQVPAPQGNNTFELIPHRVFVGGFPMGTTEAELRGFFEDFGNVREVKLIKNPDGTARGYGFVTYSSESEAAEMRAVAPERLEFKGRKLNVGPAMRRINLTTRFSDLALAHPGAALMAPYPGYAAAMPYNFLPQQVPHQPNPHYQHIMPAWPNIAVQQAPSPPGVHQGGYYQQPMGAQQDMGGMGGGGGNQNRYYRRHGHQNSPGSARKGHGGRFSHDDKHARKAGGGGGPVTPQREPTPLPPMGHPLTPLTPGYPHQLPIASVTPPTPSNANTMLYNGQMGGGYPTSDVAGEMTPNSVSEYPNYVG